MDKFISLLIIGYYSYKFIKIQSDIQLIKLKQYIDNKSETDDGDYPFF